jgi:hypothetical protein
MKKYRKINEADSFTEKEVGEKLLVAFRGGPAATRAFLDSDMGKSDICRGLLLKPKLDGNEKDDIVNISDKPGTPVLELIPTQRFIDLMQSVGFPLSSKDSLVKAIVDKKGFGTIVISPDKEGTLIIDGHHRWSGIFCIAPDGTMNAKQIQWPGVGTKEKLAAAQLAIAAKLGPSKETPSKGGEPAFNILGKKKVEIAKLIMENINKPDLVDKKVREFGGLLNDKMMKDIIDTDAKDTVYKWCGLDTSEKDITKVRQAIANKVGENLERMKLFNPNAPAREDMPQFDPDVKNQPGPELKDVEGDLTAGNFNISPPFNKPAAPASKPAVAQNASFKYIKTYEKFMQNWKK